MIRPCASLYRCLLWLPLCIALLAFTVGSAQAAKTPELVGHWFRLEKQSPVLSREGDDRPAWQYLVRHSGALALTLNLKADGRISSDLVIVVEDESGGIASRIDADALRRVLEIGGFVAARVPGGIARIKVYGDARDTAIAIPGYVRWKLTPKRELPVGRKDYESVGDFVTDPAGAIDAAASRGLDAVARLLVTRTDSNKGVPCTGFLVSSMHLVTAGHCLEGEVASVTAEFRYDTADDESLSVAVSPRPLAWSSVPQKLDFAVLEVLQPGRLRGVTPTVIASADTATPPPELVLVQHPGGRPKQIVRWESKQACGNPRCGACGGFVQLKVFRHSCDARGGSSGAPLFDEQGRVVGIHLAAWTLKETKRLNWAMAIDPVRERLTELGIAFETD